MLLDMQISVTKEGKNRKYKIFYGPIEIGVLEINTDGKYRYTPNEKGLEEVKNQVSLNNELLKKSDWRDPIPFFKERLDNASGFQSDVIAYHTDLFRMVKM